VNLLVFLANIGRYVVILLLLILSVPLLFAIFPQTEELAYTLLSYIWTPVKGILRGIVAYIPNFLSWVVLAGMLIDILSTDGLLNQITGLFGAKPVSFLGNPKVFPWTMIISDIWKNFGYGAIIYLAALTSVDPGRSSGRSRALSADLACDPARNRSHHYPYVSAFLRKPAECGI
jgi:ABC-type polysaccharide transport system permease subunit